MQLVRHGDLLLKPIDSIPKDAKLTDSKILAYGESTGHIHEIKGNAQILVTQDQKFVNVLEQSMITHQEHKTVQLEQGMYELINEQEFDPFAGIIQRVRD